MSRGINLRDANAASVLTKRCPPGAHRPRGLPGRPAGSLRLGFPPGHVRRDRPRGTKGSGGAAHVSGQGHLREPPLHALGRKAQPATSLRVLVPPEALIKSQPGPRRRRRTPSPGGPPGGLRPPRAAPAAGPETHLPGASSRTGRGSPAPPPAPRPRGGAGPGPVQRPPQSPSVQSIRVLFTRCEDEKGFIITRPDSSAMQLRDNAIVINCDGFYLISLKGYFSQALSLSLHYRPGQQPLLSLSRVPSVNSLTVASLAFKDKVYLNVTTHSSSCEDIQVNGGELILIHQSPGEYCAL
ncbi:tumor necrosis factor ligand superfamily member 4 isoform X1 [Sorex araneus]|uniref:tumor necrosis factor ligand superfamily member 4 isoform X1 n=1 Tax=Sorex araneus TaxID=42254 RepID=UPI002433C3DF|nr:tumor necrosis factor ligand superfamily member 4 isoform X1 [Sorex araneus]